MYGWKEAARAFVRVCVRAWVTLRCVDRSRARAVHAHVWLVGFFVLCFVTVVICVAAVYLDACRSRFVRRQKLRKTAGEIAGRDFTVDDVQTARILLLDHAGDVLISNVRGLVCVHVSLCPPPSSCTLVPPHVMPCCCCCLLYTSPSPRDRG